MFIKTFELSIVEIVAQEMKLQFQENWPVVHLSLC